MTNSRVGARVPATAKCAMSDRRFKGRKISGPDADADGGHCLFEAKQEARDVDGRPLR